MKYVDEKVKCKKCGCNHLWTLWRKAGEVLSPIGEKYMLWELEDRKAEKECLVRLCLNCSYHWIDDVLEVE